MKIVHNWTENTYKQYTIALESYTTYHNMTFPELLLEAEKDEETITKTGKRKIKKMIIKTFILWSKEKKK